MFNRDYITVVKSNSTIAWYCDRMVHLVGFLPNSTFHGTVRLIENIEYFPPLFSLAEGQRPRKNFVRNKEGDLILMLISRLIKFHSQSHKKWKQAIFQSNQEENNSKYIMRVTESKLAIDWGIDLESWKRN